MTRGEIKEFLMKVVEHRHNSSGGHNGFSIQELKPLMHELEKEGKIVKKDTQKSTITTHYHFLK